MEYSPTIKRFDGALIRFLRVCNFPAARLALFVVFFWFGALKVVGTSPANGLVETLLTRTMPFFPFEMFIVLFGIFEMLIGSLFLIRRLDRLTMALFAFHMVTTAMPLVLLPSVAWQSFLTPTLEGQYIIKNLVLVALAISIAAHLQPLSERQHVA